MRAVDLSDIKRSTGQWQSWDAGVPSPSPLPWRGTCLSFYSKGLAEIEFLCHVFTAVRGRKMCKRFLRSLLGNVTTTFQPPWPQLQQPTQKVRAVGDKLLSPLFQRVRTEERHVPGLCSFCFFFSGEDMLPHFGADTFLMRYIALQEARGLIQK